MPEILNVLCIKFRWLECARKKSVHVAGKLEFRRLRHFDSSFQDILPPVLVISPLDGSQYAAGNSLPSVEIVKLQSVADSVDFVDFLFVNYRIYCYCFVRSFYRAAIISVLFLEPCCPARMLFCNATLDRHLWANILNKLSWTTVV